MCSSCPGAEAKKRSYSVSRHPGPTPKLLLEPGPTCKRVFKMQLCNVFCIPIKLKKKLQVFQIAAWFQILVFTFLENFVFEFSSVHKHLN